MSANVFAAGDALVAHPRVLCLVDGANLLGHCRTRAVRPDFPTLVTYLVGGLKGVLLEAYVYLPLPAQESDGIRRFHRQLQEMGLIVVAKHAQLLPNGRSKCNMDVELTIDALTLVPIARPDVVVIVSADGDLAPLAVHLRRMGVRVVAAACSGDLAHELRLGVNACVSLDDWLAVCPPGDGWRGDAGDPVERR